MSCSISVDHAIDLCRCRLIALSDISQGSVATHMRCDGIFNNSVATNIFLIPTVKNFLKTG